MKKMPQPDEDSTPQPVSVEDSIPVLPGTEEARSLGDIIRQAEAVQQSSETAAPSNALGAQSQSRPRGKKPGRAQARRYARERALQALYQWDVSGDQSSVVRQQFLDQQEMSRVDVDYFIKLFNGVSHNPAVLDEELAYALDRALTSLDPIERAVLRLSTYELTTCLDIPARVIINEGIEITKRFGADKGHRYINGVLDKLALKVRPLEMKRR